MPLELNPEIYRAVLESLPIGVYLTDRKRQISFWNTSAEKITGYLGQEVIGRCCHDNLLMHCDENHVSLCGCACPLAQTMQDGRAREAAAFLHHKEGQRVPVRVRAIPIRDEFGAIIGAAECFEERSFRAIERRCSRRRMDVSLDDMTEIPDRRATLAGLDAALYAAAQTLSGGTRPGDLVGRWREDRFARSCRRRDRIAARLGSEAGPEVLAASKPPRMWWRTYDRLLARARRANSDAFGLMEDLARRR